MAKKKQKDRSGSVIETIHAIHAAHNRLLDRVISPLKLSNEQCNVLQILSTAPAVGLALKQIQKLVPNNTSNTTRLVDKLALKKLLIKKSARTDRRELRILITPEGSKTLEEVQERTTRLKKLLKKSIKRKGAKLLDAQLKIVLTSMEKFLSKTDGN